MSASILSRLQALRDEPYAAFQAKIIPNIPADRFIGVRVPQLRKVAKELKNTPEADAFLADLPHAYYDENYLHSLLLNDCKDYQTCLEQVTAFLPYIDNWAVCDVLHPKSFRKNTAQLLPQVKAWIRSPEPYTCRFGIGTLMTYYLDDEFRPEYLQLPAAVTSTEYYVRMMVAWYYATALAKQWPDAIRIIEAKVLPHWTHNKAIQKSCESYCISEESKHYLKTLKIAKGT